jgi:hypothetical protein
MGRAAVGLTVTSRDQPRSWDLMRKVQLTVVDVVIVFWR